MSLATDLYTYLTGDTVLNGIVNGSVNPIVSRDGDLPTMVYNFSGNFQQPTMGKGKTAQKVDIQLDFYTRDYGQLQTVIDRLDALFNSRVFSMGNTAITGSFISNSLETVDDSDDLTYRLITEITVFY